MVDEQGLAGALLDDARDALPVVGAERERAQDQEVERALQEGVTLFGIFLTPVFFYFIAGFTKQMDDRSDL